MEKPETIKHAALLWVVAILAGVIETVLAVSAVAKESGIDGDVWMNVGMRSAIYIGAFVLVAFFASGRRWARWSLALLLSVIGLVSLVIEPIRFLAEGESFIAAFGGDSEFAIAFFVTRMTHIAAVLLATVLMFAPSANRYFGKRAEPIAA
ncbi:hypothetical protein [Glycomyces harbinensis]|uniref:Uncharacterized protein n=1 Tax=Glycomyces harbinensis TaxID=58114 RepID=A0A1G7DJE2_9ACTN|nr:hypothetical protein [Glycomyces harbinensis]SDE51196.1 hypothetical protein SAMN05216270_12544 [Glycomyces harbinensis]